MAFLQSTHKWSGVRGNITKYSTQSFDFPHDADDVIHSNVAVSAHKLFMNALIPVRVMDERRLMKITWNGVDITEIIHEYRVKIKCTYGKFRVES